MSMEAGYAKVPVAQGKLGLARVKVTQREKHFASEAYDVVARVVVSADGTGAVAHVGKHRGHVGRTLKCPVEFIQRRW